MNISCLSNCKNEKDRSNKLCVCGGHNTNNPKSNKNNHSTKQKLNIKILRKNINKIKYYSLDLIGNNIDIVV